jgi:pimeloyl-ACP methyl ester carboxylesterase
VPTFTSDELTIAYEVYGEGDPVLLIHGFASSGIVNWVETGWVDALAAAGWRAITIDNRGHGLSDKPHEAAPYLPRLMARDAARLLDHLGIESAPVMGYSLGGRIAAFLALNHPQRVTCCVWGGMGMNLVTGMEDTPEIIEALLAPSLADVPSRTGRQFRIFADRTGADRQALAKCLETSRTAMPEDDVRRIGVPVLVVVGEEDAIAGDPQGLTDLLQEGELVIVPRRDHMRTTGDPAFKSAALAYLERHR